jgi:hypothetical protein
MDWMSGDFKVSFSNRGIDFSSLHSIGICFATCYLMNARVVSPENEAIRMWMWPFTST